MRCCVYLVTNRVNGKQYVGFTSQRPQVRWSAHKTSARKGSPFRFHAAIRDYGEASFEFEVLVRCDSVEVATRLEAHWIAKLNTVASGYNTFAAAGRVPNGYRHSDMSIGRMRAACKGRTLSTVALARSLEVRSAGLSDEAKTRMAVSQVKRRAENPTTIGFIENCSAAQQGRYARERAIGIVRTASKETIAKRTPKLKEAWARRKANGWTPPAATDEFRAKMVVINGERARAKTIRTTCKGCDVTLTEDNTMTNPKRRSGLHHRCRVCEAAHLTNWHAAHPGYEAERARKRRAAAVKT